MALFKKIIPLTLSALLIGGCSTNMSNRIKETLVVQSGSFNRLKAKNIVRESLQYPSSEFNLSLEWKNLTEGNFPIHILKGYMIPPGERMIFALVDPLTHAISAEFEFEELPSGKVKVFSKNGIYEAEEIPFITADGVLSGKPVQYVIASKHKKTSAMATLMPLPITTQSEDGKTISLTVSHPMKTRFILNGEGFTPNEPVTLHHKSENLEEVVIAIADETGKIEAELKPYIIGKLGGMARVDINDLSLDYPWGGQLDKAEHNPKSTFPILFVINERADLLDESKIQKAFASHQFKF